MPIIVHMAMSAAPDTLLIRNWIEARKLWDYLQTIRHLTPLSAKIIARDLGVHPATVRRAVIGRADRGIEMVSQMLGDPRFPLLTDDDLPWLPPTL